MRNQWSKPGGVLTVALAAILLAIAGGSAAWSSTIRLERSGTGDFTVLQDALDAAATGDTIRIGPGRYDDFRIETFLSGGVAATIGNIHVDSLTLLGESADTVFIGPEAFTVAYEEEFTYCILADNFDPVYLTLRGVTLENTRSVLSLSGDADISDCTFRSESILSVRMDYEYSGGSVQVQDCLFARTETPSAYQLPILGSAIGYGPARLELSGCRFENVGFALSSIDSVDILDVAITDDSAFFYATDGRVQRLSSINAKGRAIITDSSDLLIEDSVFQGGGTSNGITADFNSNSRIVALRSEFLPAQSGPDVNSTIVVWSAYSVEVHESDILPGPEYSVYGLVESTKTPEVDFTNNYWGTTDSLEIESLIWDQADSEHPDYPTHFDLTRVRFWPVLDQSVPTQGRSVGGFKGRFHRPGSSEQD